MAQTTRGTQVFHEIKLYTCRPNFPELGVILTPQIHHIKSYFRIECHFQWTLGLGLEKTQTWR